MSSSLIEDTIDFKKNFENNFNYLMKNYRDYNNKHGLNEENKRKWINNQFTDYRKELCETLIKYTKYITFDETLKNTKYNLNKVLLRENLIDETGKLTSNASKTPLYFFYSKNKSDHFLNVYAYHYLVNELHYNKDNIYFIRLQNKNILNIILNEIRENIIFLIDDFSYSGSQMSKLLDKIYVDVMKQEELKLNVNVCLVGLTSVAKQKLDYVPDLNHPKNKIWMKQKMYDFMIMKIDTPFHIVYNSDHYVPSFDKLYLNGHINDRIILD
jgi:hypothetical protein